MKSKEYLEELRAKNKAYKQAFKQSEEELGNLQEIASNIPQKKQTNVDRDFGLFLASFIATMAALNEGKKS